jgi:hypothetical protein
MKAREYKVFTDAVAEAVNRLPRRFDKRGESKLAELLTEQNKAVIEEQIIDTICEWFEFEQEGD